MRSIPSQLPNGQQVPDQAHSVRTQLIGWGALYLAFLVLLFAISYPVAVASGLALATAIALGVRVRHRRRNHYARRRCVPLLGLCLKL